MTSVCAGSSAKDYPLNGNTIIYLNTLSKVFLKQLFLMKNGIVLTSIAIDLNAMIRRKEALSILLEGPTRKMVHSGMESSTALCKPVLFGRRIESVLTVGVGAVERAAHKTPDGMALS